MSVADPQTYLVKQRLFVKRWEKVDPHDQNLVAYYSPKYGGTQFNCSVCNAPADMHGYHNEIQKVVCPGDWLVLDEDYNRRVVSNKNFEENYTLIK